MEPATSADVRGADDRCADATERLGAALPPEAVLDEAVALLKGFADPTRLKILLMLKGGEVCVYQIVDALGVSQPAVSHQLRTLRSARLVDFNKRGRHVFYRLADDHVHAMLDEVISHSQELW